MTTNLAVKESIGEAVERVLVGGDLGKLSADERMAYYKSVCQSVGLNPLTRPLEFITLNGKLTLYARKDATDQLRANNQVSISIVGREVVEGCYVVTAKATMPSGRCDESIGAVPIESLKGEARSNALMKCETKAKRRVTLSICGMGMLDESEIDSVPGARIDVQAQQSIAKRIADAEAEWQAEMKPASKPLEFSAGDKVPEFAGYQAHENGWVPDMHPQDIPPSKPDFQPLPPLAELVEKAKKQPLEMKFIDRGRVVNFNKSFREALPAEFKPRAEDIRHAWLASKLILKEGNPSADGILLRDFERIKAEAIAFAKEYNGEMSTL